MDLVACGGGGVDGVGGVGGGGVEEGGKERCLGEGEGGGAGADVEGAGGGGGGCSGGLEVGGSFRGFGGGGESCCGCGVRIGARVQLRRGGGAHGGIWVRGGTGEEKGKVGK